MPRIRAWNGNLGSGINYGHIIMPDSRLEFVAKIAVFDSGLGSLSIIKAIQRNFKAEIIYLADQKNYPYGTKSQAQLGSIIEKSIKSSKSDFHQISL